MSDMGHQWTDEQIAKLRGRFDKEYSQAAREMQEKLEKALADYDRENSQRLKALDGTPQAQKLYDEWKRDQAVSQTWMRDMVYQLSESATHANMHAADMINDCIPHVYAENANMSAFALDKQLGFDTGFTLVNEDAVRYLMGLPLQKTGDDQLLREVTWNPDIERIHVQDLRKREVDYPKDMRWNREKFQSAITQGILQGESIPNIVKRTKDIYGRNKASATRAARTATTNAENAGRMNTFERAQRLGIDMEIEWLATPDGRTRSSHRALDGERIQLGERFSNGLRWPADPYGPASEIWNCRCRANGRVVGFDGKRGDWADERGQRWTRLPKGMTYDDWKKVKAVSREESYKNPSKLQEGFWPQTQSSDELAVDAFHPETLGGVRRTSEGMTFDQANELRGNPNYNLGDEEFDALQEARRARNKAYEDAFMTGNFDAVKQTEEAVKRAEKALKEAQKQRVGYTTNCQSCVVANEARRRGYDVEAVARTKGSMAEKLAYNTSMAWIDPSTGKHPQYVTYDGIGKTDSVGMPIPTHKRYVKWLNADGTIVEGDRYTIEFDWKGKSKSGHILSIERTKDGLRMYDTQCGKTYFGDEIADYLANAKYRTTSYGFTYANGPKLLKISDCQFNQKVCDQILTGATE